MRKNERGQALLESLIVTAVLVLVTYGMVECIRILAFKALLKTATFEVASNLAHRDLLAQRLVREQGQDAFQIAVAQRAQQEIEAFLTAFPTGHSRGDFPVRVYVNVNPQGYPPGISIHVNSCLNLWFLHRHPLTGTRRASDRTLETTLYSSDSLDGKRLVKDAADYRPTQTNCLGQIDRLSRDGVLVQASTYMPWSAARQIYSAGFREDKKMPGLGFPELAPLGSFGSALSDGVSALESIVNGFADKLGKFHEVTEKPDENSRTRVESALGQSDFKPVPLLR